jgi:hypothetical protein
MKPTTTLTKKHQDIFEMILAARAYHQEKFVKQARSSEKILRGKTEFLPESIEQKDIVNPNLSFSTVRNYVPTLLPPNVKVYVSPETPEWGKAKKNNIYSAILMQNCLAKYRHQLKMLYTDKQASLCGLVQGLAYSWDAWVLEEGSINPTIVKDQPMHRYIAGTDLVPDPDGLEFEDKAYVARLFNQRSWRMKKMGYHNIEDEKKPVNYLDRTKGQYEMPGAPTYFEIYHKETEKIYTMSESMKGGSPLLHAQQDFDIKHGFPFDPLIYNPMIDNFYPLSLLSVFESVQRALILMATWANMHLKRAIPKIAVLDQYLSPLAKRKLQSGEDMAMVPIRVPNSLNKGDVDIRKIITNLNAPGLPSDFPGVWNMFMGIVNQLSGVHEQARGSSQTEKTATEATLLDAYLKSRYTDYRFITDNWLIDSSERTIRLIRDNASGDKWMKFNRMEFEAQHFFNDPGFQPQQPALDPRTGQPKRNFFSGKPQLQGNPNIRAQGDLYFVKWKKEDISGQYDLEVGVGPGVPVNAEYEFKKALHKLNIAKGHPMIDQRKAVIEFYRDLKHPHPESMVAPPPPGEKPNSSFSFKLEDLEGAGLNPTQIAVMRQAGYLPEEKPPGAPGPGGPGRNDSTALANELDKPGLNYPPGAPEV